MDLLELTATPLSNQSLDRDEISRADPNLFDRFWDDPRTRIVAFHGEQVAIQGGKLALFESSEMTTATARVYLGKTTVAAGNLPADAPILAYDISDSAFRDAQNRDFEWHSVRDVILGDDPWESGIIAQGLAILRWHREGVYCPRCGTPTIPMSGGWMRKCVECDNEIFPRTDPAVIVAILDADDRLLLGNPKIRPNWWSLFSGFIEAGESVDAAIRREMLEEAGIEVEPETYLGTQPWPFPRSLMIGYSARAVPGQQPHPDGDEIAELRWVSKQEFASWSKTVTLPKRPSISHAIIEHWYGSPIEGE